MLQLGVKMSLGVNVTVDQLSNGRSVRVEMSLGRSVGGRSVTIPNFDLGHSFAHLVDISIVLCNYLIM
jgi:hypothetical protein